jgi:hypothetical protein
LRKISEIAATRTTGWADNSDDRHEMTPLVERAFDGSHVDTLA